LRCESCGLKWILPYQKIWDWKLYSIKMIKHQNFSAYNIYVLGDILLFNKKLKATSKP
jgi:hypothetical protein